MIFGIGLVLIAIGWAGLNIFSPTARDPWARAIGMLAKIDYLYVICFYLGWICCLLSVVLFLWKYMP